MPKAKVAADEKLEGQDFDLFKAIEAIDRKDYGFYDRLTPEQQKKFVPFMMVQWISAVKGRVEIQEYYLRSTDYNANTHLFNEQVQKNPKLQWLMLCAASPGVGKQFHQFIPQIRDKVKKLREAPSQKEIKDYFKKIYPGVLDTDISEITNAYLDSNRKQLYIANNFPDMKYDEIDLLAGLISDEDIAQYEKDLGN